MSRKDFIILLATCILASLLTNTVRAEPEPKPEPEPEPKPVPAGVSVKGGRPAYVSRQPQPEYRQIAVVEDDDDVAAASADVQVGKGGDASSGRLFLTKLMLFRNLLNGNTQQPVIVLTGNTGTSPTTITSTGTIPTATGTITTSPATRSMGEDESDGREDLGDETEGGEAAIDPQTLQEALTAGAQEYVVTDADSKASKQSNRISLRRNGAKKGQVISVRIPPRYRRYFKNGQKVMLNTQNSNRRQKVKRRVVRKRISNVRRPNNRRRVQA